LADENSDDLSISGYDGAGLMKIAIYFSEKLILFLFRLYNYVKFKIVKK